MTQARTRGRADGPRMGFRRATRPGAGGQAAGADPLAGLSGNAGQCRLPPIICAGRADAGAQAVLHLPHRRAQPGRSGTGGGARVFARGQRAPAASRACRMRRGIAAPSPAGKRTACPGDRNSAARRRRRMADDTETEPLVRITRERLFDGSLMREFRARALPGMARAQRCRDGGDLSTQPSPGTSGGRCVAVRLRLADLEPGVQFAERCRLSCAAGTGASACGCRGPGRRTIPA